MSILFDKLSLWAELYMFVTLSIVLPGIKNKTKNETAIKATIRNNLENLEILIYEKGIIKNIKSVNENEDIDIMLYDEIINSRIKKIYERKKSKK